MPKNKLVKKSVENNEFTFQKSHALRDQLSWTHYRLLLKVKTDEARSFYELT